jgi:hypothetical protein
MIRPDEQDIIGTRPRPRHDDLPLWATPPAPPALPSELRSPSDYAQLAAFSRDGMKLNAIAARAANAILDFQRSVSVWEIRIALQGLGEIANDGNEKLDGLGGLARGMGLVAVDSERPPAWAMTYLGKSHGNHNIVWARPQDVGAYTAAERRRRIAA